jgi:hypothetical protein
MLRKSCAGLALFGALLAGSVFAPAALAAPTTHPDLTNGKANYQPVINQLKTINEIIKNVPIKVENNNYFRTVGN